MDQNYLNILEDSLKKKIQVLDKIKTLSDEQFNAMSGDEVKLEDFDSYIEQKGTLIEELEKLDNGFETLYSKVSEELTGNKEKYAEQIKRMQNLIREITEKSNAIQAKEERNRDLIGKYFDRRRGEVREGRVNSKAAMNYYKVQSNSSYVDSQFLDSKK
jgi:flagellar biosynthesis/type III secretory pathway chaperone